jgi:hypothetical protein
MHTFTEFFLSGMRPAVWASLAGSAGVNFEKENAALPSNPLEDFQKTTPGCI